MWLLGSESFWGEREREIPRWKLYSFYDRALKLTWHHFCCTLLVKTITSPLPDSKRETMTCWLEKSLSHCKKSMWAGICWCGHLWKIQFATTFKLRLISREEEASKKVFTFQVKGRWYFWHGPLLLISSSCLEGVATILCLQCDKPIWEGCTSLDVSPGLSAFGLLIWGK